MQPAVSMIGVSFGEIGIFIFFTISGYLIAMSYCSRHDLKAFVVARVLRIFPAVCVCVWVSAFIIGPCLSSLSVADYFKNISVYKYSINNTVLLLRGYITDALPGVFMTNPFPRAFNGSLWTLPVELRMYLAIAVIGVLGLLRRRWLTSVLLLASLFIIVVECQQGPLELLVWRLPVFFLAGVLFYLNRDFIPSNTIILAALGTIAVLAFSSVSFPILGGSFLVYAVFWFAYVPDGWIRKFNDLGDYSYGLYIYAFPVQQTLAALRPGIAPLSMFLAAFPLTLGLAVVSWHVVEKPSLALKERIGTFSLFKWRRKVPSPATTEQSVAVKLRTTEL